MIRHLHSPGYASRAPARNGPCGQSSDGEDPPNKQLGGRFSALAAGASPIRRWNVRCRRGLRVSIFCSNLSRVPEILFGIHRGPRHVNFPPWEVSNPVLQIRKRPWI